MTATVIKDRERARFSTVPSQESLSDLRGQGWLPTDIGDEYSVIRWIKGDGQIPSGFFRAWIAKLRASIPPSTGDRDREISIEERCSFSTGGPARWDHLSCLAMRLDLDCQCPGMR